MSSRTTKSEKAELRFPVSRVQSLLTTQENRVSDSSAVYMAAVLEYVTAEIVELSLKAAHSERKSLRIQPIDLDVALKRDKDFSRARIFKTADATISNASMLNTAVLAKVNENKRRRSVDGEAGPSTGRIWGGVRKTGNASSSTKNGHMPVKKNVIGAKNTAWKSANALSSTGEGQMPVKKNITGAKSTAGKSANALSSTGKGQMYVKKNITGAKNTAGKSGTKNAGGESANKQAW